jgi:G:T-mismatch repair DNA endonuclease (very short patch repair protein)
MPQIDRGVVFLYKLKYMDYRTVFINKMKVKKKNKFRKTLKKMNGTSNLEVNFGKLLTELNIKYKQHFIFKKREFDFLLVDYNILIETHGCFFHCCKQHNPEAKYALQRRNIKNDQYKVKLVKFDKNYKLLIIWEHEMNDLLLLTEKVKNNLGKMINIL